MHSANLVKEDFKEENNYGEKGGGAQSKEGGRANGWNEK